METEQALQLVVSLMQLLWTLITGLQGILEQECIMFLFIRFLLYIHALGKIISSGQMLLKTKSGCPS